MKTAGTKYEQTKDLDITAIAKLVRADIKARKELAGLKVSVKIDRYSQGQSITCRVQPSAAEAIAFVNPAWVDEDLAGIYPHTAKRLSERGAQVDGALSEILASYNDGEWDHHTDYHRTRFHADVIIGADYSGAAEARRRAA